jgi:hypothetical protein
VRLGMTLGRLPEPQFCCLNISHPMILSFT